MSKLILVCYRNQDNTDEEFKNKIKILSNKLSPDNVIPKEPLINNVDSMCKFGIINPFKNQVLKNGSVCLGTITNCEDTWWRPLSNIPNGDYALFRCNNELIELVADSVGSRTVWYYMDENIFLCSTSQRAIIAFLGDYKPNKNVLPWILSSGTLGPGYSWDERIKNLEHGSKIILDRKRWVLNNRRIINVNQEPKLVSKFGKEKAQLQNVLSETFSNYKKDFNYWSLPLSGGVDSRALLLLFNKYKNIKLKCITWGEKDSITKKGSDAFVAKKLVDKYELDHKYYVTNKSNESLAKILNRFIKASEGRIDHIAGYMDGMSLWKDLYNSGVEGILRGDEGFGWKPVYDSKHARTLSGLCLLTDYSNIPPELINELNKQEIPSNLEKKGNERLEDWRDRLYHEFRIPYILAALNEAKLSYVEVANPLLSNKIIYFVKRLDKKYRTNKVLFKRIVNDLNPDIEFASIDSNEDTGSILKRKEFREFLIRELENAKKNNGIISVEILNYTIESLSNKNTSESKYAGRKKLKKFILNNFPHYINKFLYKNRKNSMLMDTHKFAFRVFMICKMHQVLLEDSLIFKDEK